MNPWMIVLTIVGVVIVLPLVASFLMLFILESANNEGLYDDEDA
jgi:hypothetical protein